MPEIENGQNEKQRSTDESDAVERTDDTSEAATPVEPVATAAPDTPSGVGELMEEQDDDDDDDEVLFVEVDASGFEDADSGPVSETEAELRARIEELEAENKSLYQRMLRVAADAENLKRRTEREKEEIRRFGMEKILLDLVPVLDNFDRALNHSASSQDHASLMEGVSMVQRQFVQALLKYGCQSFDSLGTPFDPQRHEAVSQVENAEKQPNTVVEEYQKGYFLNDRLIRPAMVVVSRLPPGATPPPEPESEDTPTDEVPPEADAPSSPEADAGEVESDEASSPDPAQNET